MNQRNGCIIKKILVFFICTFLLGAFLFGEFYFRMLLQQKRNMEFARAQLDTLFTHVVKSGNKMMVLVGAPCNEKTIKELRENLAITPNIGNIELAKKGRVYCSSLAGNHTLHEIRKQNRMYLSSDVKSLPGHMFILFNFQKGEYSLYTSTDGYYIESILESASIYFPVFIGMQVDLNGVGERLYYKRYLKPFKSTVSIKSENYPFILSSKITMKLAIAKISNYARFEIFIFSLLTLLFGIFYYILNNRTETQERILGVAMERNEIKPYFQAIMQGNPPKLIGCEVLVRWKHKGDLISPDLFIPLAEKSGLIIPLTRKLIKDVVEIFSVGVQLPSCFYISFNVSVSHLCSPSFVSDFELFLSNAPSQVSLVLELTEREILIEDEYLAENIQTLKNLGVRFALDDFGTGYSTLESVQKVPVDFIKIDKTFVSGIVTNNVYKKIVENIVDLATRLNVSLIAEGVEEKEQLEALGDMADMAYQGYLFSKPLSENDFKHWLKNNDFAPSMYHSK